MLGVHESSVDVGEKMILPLSFRFIVPEVPNLAALDFSFADVRLPSL